MYPIMFVAYRYARHSLGLASSECYGAQLMRLECQGLLGT